VKNEDPLTLDESCCVITILSLPSSPLKGKSLLRICDDLMGLKHTPSGGGGIDLNILSAIQACIM
ncbi:hypothetical protein NDU88_006383, partial [Pleurodeles waltl]